LFYNYEHKIVASEPVANLSLQWQEIEPGTMISIMSGQSIRVGTAPRSNCFFEDVYFSHVSSHWAGRSVYNTRRHYGQILASREDVEADAVVPVPNSGIAAAEAMAETLGIPLRLGICQNRYSPRTFIAEGGQADKYVLTPEALRGRLLVVDDSIVRGSTMRELMPMLRQYATEIHLRITCPKITHPCRYGINITGKGAHFIEGADSIRFLEPEDLLPGTCRACVTGNYPNGEKNACTVCKAPN
jgi:amidophosphoribosyltransferase